MEACREARYSWWGVWALLKWEEATKDTQIIVVVVVVQSLSRVQLCDPMDCSLPGFSVLHYHLEFAQTHVHWVSDAIQPSRSLSSPSPPALSFPALETFPMSQLFSSGDQSIGASASASVLPVNIQGWFPLELTGLISLQSKRFSRVFSNPTIQKHQFFGSRPSLSRSHIHTWLLKKP